MKTKIAALALLATMTTAAHAGGSDIGKIVGGLIVGGVVGYQMGQNSQNNYPGQPPVALPSPPMTVSYGCQVDVYGRQICPQPIYQPPVVVYSPPVYYPSPIFGFGGGFGHHRHW